MGYHVPKQFIVNFVRFECPVQSVGHGGNFLNEHCSCFPVEMEQLCNMLFAEDEGIAGKELVTIEEDVTLPQLSYPELGFVFPFRAHLAMVHIFVISLSRQRILRQPAPS
jgi:hypothetical protein